MDTQAQVELQAQRQEEKEEEGQRMEELEKHVPPCTPCTEHGASYAHRCLAATLDTMITLTLMITNGCAATRLAEAANPPVLTNLLAATILAVLAPSVVYADA